MSDISKQLRYCVERERMVAGCLTERAANEIEWLERDLAEARAKVTAIRETCHWRENEDGAWWSDCKRGYEFTTDGPAANKFAWCPFCGKQCVPIAFDYGSMPAIVDTLKPAVQEAGEGER